MQAQAGEMFERFINEVRRQNGIPEGLSITEYLSVVLAMDQEVFEHVGIMRVELSWDDFISMWSIRFYEDGKVIETQLYLRDEWEHRPAIEAIRRSSGVDTVAEMLELAMPHLIGHYGEKVRMVWEYYGPAFDGQDIDLDGLQFVQIDRG